MVLLLDLPMLLRKVQVQLQLQLQHNLRRVKERTQIQVQNELHDSFDSEFERLLNFDKSLSEEEEEEGYAPLDDDIEDNYVGVEEEYDD